MLQRNQDIAKKQAHTSVNENNPSWETYAGNMNINECSADMSTAQLIIGNRIAGRAQMLYIQNIDVS